MLALRHRRRRAMTDEREMPRPPRRPEPATSPRQPGYSSGDRNTKRSEKDWKGFSGGSQRDAAPAPEGTSPAKDTTKDTNRR
jgi:hypothetical protein